jgi:hypothetical protein
MCGQRVHLIQHQQMSSFLVTRRGSGGRRRQSRTVMMDSLTNVLSGSSPRPPRGALAVE